MIGATFGVACGGRTGALEVDPDGAGADGSGARAGGGGSAVAGKPTSGGSGPIGGAPAGGTSAGGSGVAGGYFPGGAGGYVPGGAGGYFPGGAGGSVFGGAGGYFPGGAGGYFPGGAGGAPPNCQSCLALACGFPLLECAQDPGCADIFVCVQATGCMGLDCYSPNTCRSVIDDTGGLGSDSMSRLLSALTCVVQSGCACY